MGMQTVAERSIVKVTDRRVAIVLSLLHQNPVVDISTLAASPVVPD